MSLKEKIKRKLIHWCGGYTADDLPNKKVEIVKTIYPIEKIQYCHKYFLNETPRKYIDEEAANYLAKEIIKNRFYESTTEGSMESPGLVMTSYSIYIAHPPKD